MKVQGYCLMQDNQTPTAAMQAVLGHKLPHYAARTTLFTPIFTPKRGTIYSSQLIGKDAT